jgi:threonine/homoserine/homoserine lactone efflux protein
MNGSLFFEGVVVGLLMALPLGPIAVLCIQRSLNQGKIHGMVSGFGAASADAIYGFIAVSGLTFISDFLVKEQVCLRLVSGLFLCYMGVKVFRTKPVQRVTPGNNTSYFNNYISALLLTLANAGTFFVFAAVFAGLGLVRESGHYSSSGVLIAGVFVGSGTWWFTLSSITGIFKEKLGYSRLGLLNKISGIIITGFGLFVLVSMWI